MSDSFSWELESKRSPLGNDKRIWIFWCDPPQAKRKHYDTSPIALVNLQLLFTKGIPAKRKLEAGTDAVLFKYFVLLIWTRKIVSTRGGHASVNRNCRVYSGSGLGILHVKVVVFL